MTRKPTHRPSCLIAGASSGIGRATAFALAEAGFDLFLLGRDARRLESARSACEKSGAKAVAFRTDLERSGSSDEIFRSFDRTFSRLEGLVYSAGAYARQPLAKTTDADLERMFRSNVAAPLALIRSAAPRLRQARGASSVIVSSTLGLRPVAGAAAYSLSKAAINSLAQCLAIEWGPMGIRCNAVCPGVVDTPIHDSTWSPKEKRRIFKELAARLPSGRIGRPKDVAALITYLVSPPSAWLTGALIPIDGGISLIG